MNDHYILDGKKPILVDSMTWAKWFEKVREGRIVAKTKIGLAEVSTVFLGLDHNWSGSLPHIFETLVFGGKLDGEMDRYSTWDEAETGHTAMCKRVEALLDPEGE